MPTHQPHTERAVAESFGGDTARYDRARPGYPADLVERIAAESPGPDLLEAGIGTGIAARALRAAGLRVHGVDPDPRMAQAARRHGFTTDVARFEDWQPAGRSFDTVVAAQAWHWVDPDAGAVQAARVLRPDGLIAVFWNVFRAPPAVAEAFGRVYSGVLPDLPAYPWADALTAYRAMCATAADGLRRSGAFGAPQEWRFDWRRPYTKEEWLDQVPTLGGCQLLPAGTRAELLDGLGAAIDALGGGFEMGYTTVAVTARRVPGR